jgi:hypothetical protein
MVQDTDPRHGKNFFIASLVDRCFTGRLMGYCSQ